MGEERWRGVEGGMVMKEKIKQLFEIRNNQNRSFHGYVL